ncbi:MAG: helix-turn-helix domain-containing protein [Cyanobacteria bacterium P01_E01_bin.6]
MEKRPVDNTDTLRSLMNAAGVSSFRELSRTADVSLWQIQQLRHGPIEQMRLAPLTKLSQALQLSLHEFISAFSNSAPDSGGHSQPHTKISSPESIQNSGIDDSSSPNPQYAALQSEYARLQQQSNHQRDQVIGEQVQAALTMLESWMVQWPTAAKAAQNNDTIPASRLIPLVRPIENLLASWGVTAIAAVGDELPYDPTQHQLMSGTAQSGDPVRVRYIGYRHHDKLLHRAKVSPIGR